MSLPTDASAEDTLEKSERRTAWLLLAVLSASYFAFALLYVPRLNNYVMSDKEFTGWTSPIAQRLFGRERLYEDFVLPIPPASFALLALVQRITGRARLLQELWVNAICHWLFGLLGYFIARQFTTRRIAILVALGTVVLVTQTPKECAYDQTSLVVAWLSVLSGAKALLSTEPRRRRQLLFATGFLAAVTLAWKQSTATGIVLGWGIGLAYLVLVEVQARRPEALRARLVDAGWVIAGVPAGLSVVLATLVALRASVPGFFRAVILDGPSLKGGAEALLLDLLAFTFRDNAMLAAFVPAVVVAGLSLAASRRRGLHVGELEREGSLQTRSAVLLGLACLSTFLPAIACLLSGAHGFTQVFVATMDGLRMVPAYGFLFGALFFGAHVKARDVSETIRDRGHAFNAVFLAALVASLIYDTSWVRFEPFYYTVPFIPFVLGSLFLVTERSGARWATPLALALTVLPMYGTKLSRAMSDDVVLKGGYWSGLRVNYRGVQIVQAARRAQELAGPSGTVLVLPEDLALVGLIQRPRPKLRGAVLFVDQYPERLLEGDLRAIDEHPPDVIVIHPHRRSDWKRLFQTWKEGSAAARFVDHVLSNLLPKYQRDSSYPTIFFWDQGQLDVYVRKDKVTE